ncbi:hypothetical protein MCGE09_00376 [Thaumarchaeota archaeon SCGC AB-539-E09]|nr:hypothetical protein MCGE09_00376 [Thaumarchaeota archaeon SCGC AB-539-E09]
MNDKQFKELNKKLDIITRLLAQSLLKDIKYQKEKILILSSIGYKALEIADLLSTTTNTVYVTLSEAKRDGIIS